jgi:Mg2+ and Co2+ transporter CorA
MNVRLFPATGTLLGGVVALVLMVVLVGVLYLTFKQRDWL